MMFFLGILQSLSIARYFKPGMFTVSVFTGDVARVISVVFLLLGFYLLSRRENPIGFLISLGLSFVFAYMGGILRILGG